MLSIHGVHQWEVIPGLPDTGGQNLFVNQFSDELDKRGFKVTIINRGGYQNPITKTAQEGLHYKNENQRIFYLRDGLNQFVHKEDMGDRIPQLFKALIDFIRNEGFSIDLVISHYWDAGILGALLEETLPATKHVWVPHSLGYIKQMNVSPQQGESLRIKERINAERKLIKKVENGIAATSGFIRKTLIEDYGYQGKILWLPPCVDQQRYFPRKVKSDDPVWTFLGKQAGLTPEQVQKRKIITEISRTDRTKRKDILIRAFANVLKKFPDTFLIISIDDTNTVLSRELKELIERCNVGKDTRVVGSISGFLPAVFLFRQMMFKAFPALLNIFWMMKGLGKKRELMPTMRQYLILPGLISSKVLWMR